MIRCAPLERPRRRPGIAVKAKDLSGRPVAVLGPLRASHEALLAGEHPLRIVARLPEIAERGVPHGQVGEYL